MEELPKYNSFIFLKFINKEIERKNLLLQKNLNRNILYEEPIISPEKNHNNINFKY